MTTVLITGANGYVGSVLVPHLLEEGFRVRALSRYTHRSPSLLAHCHDLLLEIVKGDCRERSVLQEALKGVDIVIPLAAIVGAPACKIDPIATRTTNVGAISQLRNLAPKIPIIFPMTNSGYGVGGEASCTEESPLNPISLYGESKRDAEAFLLSQENAISYRFATAFGASPRMRLDLLVNDFVYRAVKDRFVALYEPHFRRNYIHVRDMARAFKHVIDNFDSMKGKSYNCGLPDTFTKQQLCEQIQARVPDFQYFIAPIGEDPDKRDYLVSNERLYQTGFSPYYSLDYGIRELIKAYAMFPPKEFCNA